MILPWGSVEEEVVITQASEHCLDKNVFCESQVCIKAPSVLNINLSVSFSI